MKKIIIMSFVMAFFSMMIFVRCAGKNIKQIKTKNEESCMEVVYLKKADFCAKVADFEKNPNEWEYLGDKPALIDFYADW